MANVTLLPVFTPNNILDREIVDKKFPVSQQHRWSLMESMVVGGEAEVALVEPSWVVSLPPASPFPGTSPDPHRWKEGSPPISLSLHPDLPRSAP